MNKMLSGLAVLWLVPFSAYAHVCNLDVSPVEFNFGGVLIGTTVSAEYVIRNLDDQPCEVSSFGWTYSPGENEGFEFASGAPEPPFTLAPLSDINFETQFQPSVPGPQFAKVRIRRGTFSDPLIDIPNHGYGLSAVCRLLYEPGEVDFTTVTPGTTATVNVLVSNATNDSCRVLDIGISGSAAFTLSDDAPTLPISLTSMQEIQIGIEYAPGENTIDSGELIINSEDVIAPEFSIALSGFGGSDLDGDGVPDFLDNCTNSANHNQRDTNGDGYGNRCDPDLNNDGIVNFSDIALWVPFFLVPGANDEDFNGDGSVNYIDYVMLTQFFLQPPGPSGLVNDHP